jgi:hypothetical protein
MKILKKRSTAVVIVVILGVLFTLFGARRSLDRAAKNIESLFYNGVGSETSIQTYLDNEFKEAKVIYSTASRYLDDDTVSGFRAAYNALYNAETINEKYICYRTLKEEFSSLTQSMGSVDLEDSVKDYYSTHVTNMVNIQRMIDSSSYNEKVSEFENTVLKAFPQMF